MGSIETHRAGLSFSFKGKDGMGMGLEFMAREFEPIPTLVLPLKGRMRNALRVITWPTSVLPLKRRMSISLRANGRAVGARDSINAPGRRAHDRMG